MKVIATNKKAFHDYIVLETLEVGINLIGCEVKSVRASQLNLKDSYCSIEKGQLCLNNCYIKNYDKGSFSNVESMRKRRLLANRKEIDKWEQKVAEKGLSIVPLKIYLTGSLVKLEIALVKGKKLYDKRDSQQEKDIKRETERAIRESFK